MTARIVGTSLIAPDSPALQGFYRHVCGWSTSVHAQAGASEPHPLLRPQWLPVIECEDVQGVIDQAIAAGGSTGGSGGVVLLVDPWGATVRVTSSWAGDGLPYEPMSRRHGQPSWLQLNTPDPTAAQRFWAAVTGWEPAASDNERFTYSRFLRDGRPHAGLLAIDERTGQLPASWQTYLHSDDLAAAQAAVLDGEGHVQVRLTQLQAGCFLVAVDPAGVAVALDDMSHDLRAREP